jgi:hypothetical protein
MADPKYLPPGWTEEKFKNAKHVDYIYLTEEEVQKVVKRKEAEQKAFMLELIEARNAKRIADRAKPRNAANKNHKTLREEQLRNRERNVAEEHAALLKLFHERNAELIARGIPPIPYPGGNDDEAGRQGEKQPQPSQQVIDPAAENLTKLLDHVEQSDLEVFGFVLFRTYYADDNEESWEAFKQGYYELREEGMAAAPAEFNRIEDKVFTDIISDDSMNGQTPEGVMIAYLSCMDEVEATENDKEDDWGDAPEPGLTTSMCLMADEECIRSVLDKSATPFVKAVNVTAGRGENFKVAIASLVPAFYAALLVYSPDIVASKVSNDGIWRSMGPQDPNMRGIERAVKGMRLRS